MYIRDYAHKECPLSFLHKLKLGNSYPYKMKISAHILNENTIEIFVQIKNIFYFQEFSDLTILAKNLWAILFMHFNVIQYAFYNASVYIPRKLR